MGFLDSGETRPGQLGDTGIIVLEHCGPLLKVWFNNLCTYDLCSPVHNVLDACISIMRGSGRRLGPGIREFFGPCEMASSL
jgi:hypothetical protein